MNTHNVVYTHFTCNQTTGRDRKYIYQHFQDCEKIHEIDPHIQQKHTNDTSYPQINNDIKYVLFKNVIDNLNREIRHDFTCTKACYVHTHMIIYHKN